MKRKERKQMRLKRVFAILMSMILVIGLMPVTAQAEEIEANAVEYAITHQPTAGEPWVELNDNTDVSYQWYAMEATKTYLTNASFSTTASRYDEETNSWISYEVSEGGEASYFRMNLSVGEELYIEIIEGTVGNLWTVYSGPDEGAPIVEQIAANVYKITAKGVNTTLLYTDVAATIRAYKLELSLGDALVGETSSELVNPELGEVYCCRIITPNGELISEAFTYAYEIVTQPTSDNPKVELNDATGAAYQWYQYNPYGEEITDGNTYPSDFDAFKGTYTEGQGWTGTPLDGVVHYFIVSAVAGDVFYVSFNDGVDRDDIYVHMEYDDGSYICSTKVGDLYKIVTPMNDDYTLYVAGEDEDTVIRVYKEDVVPVQGQTSATFTGTTKGYHDCLVTFADSTVERTDKICIHEWNRGICAYCEATHECDVAQMDEYGKCTLCKKVLKAAAIWNAEGKEYFDTLEDALSSVESGDTLLILGYDEYTYSLTIPVGSKLEIIKDAKLTVGREFVNNGSVQVDGELELPGCDYDDDLEQDIPAYDINNLTNASGTGTIIIETENGTARYTYNEETGGFGCRHTQHTQDGKCVACYEEVDHVFETDTCVCGRAAGGAIVCDGKTTYYESFIEAVYDAEELINANLNAEVTVYMYLDCIFWCEISTVKFDMVLDAELYMPGDSGFTIDKDAVVTITENGSVNGNVSHISNYGTIIIPEDMEIPGVSGKTGSCIVKGDVRYAYTEENGYEICNHTAYADGYCTMCGLECEHVWDTYTSNNDATCEADGTKTASCTKECGKNNTITDTGSAKGHKYTSYKSNNDATCEADGTKTASCDNGCGKTDTIEDEGTATGHKYTNYKSDNNATCTADGTKTASCDNGCGTKNTIADTGSKKAHVDANKDGKCDIGGETLSVPVQKITYKIAFNGNGATSGTMKAMSNCVSDTEYKLTANAFKKKGYTFNGWNTKKDGKGKSYTNKASVKNLTSKNGETVTLYAQWKKTKYTITYKLNGGKNSKSNKASYYYTTKTFKLKNPTRKGYTFKGWYTDKKCTKKITQVKKGTTKNYTLYAKWAKKKYTITYVLNKGKNNKSNKKSYYVTTKTFKLKNPTRKGYTFKGWYSDKKCTKKVTKITKGTAKNIKLYAKWVKKK